MNKKYWKVVRRVDDMLVSAIVEGQESVIYKKDEFVSAPFHCQRKGYYLTLFGGFRRAFNYANQQLAEYEIWECEIGGRPIMNTMPKKRKHLDMNSKIIWDIKKRSPWPTGAYWPFGTIMARKIKLTECVKVQG